MNVIIICRLWGQSAGAQEIDTKEAASQVRQLLSDGSEDLARGDAATAEQDFRKALALDPSSVGILNDLGICLDRQGKTREAIPYYRRALKIHPVNSVAARNLAVAYFKLQRYGEAFPLLESLARRSPDNFQVLDLAGLTLFGLNRYRESTAYLERASRLQSEDLPTLYMLGQAYLREKEYSKISNVFRRILLVNPKSVEAHVMMGMAYDKTFHVQSALKEYLAAEKANSDFPGVHSGLGELYWEVGKMNEAQTELGKELKLFPSDPVSNCLMGRILFRKGQPRKSEAYFQMALRANPKYKDALIGLSRAELQGNQLRKALAVLETAVKRYPESSRAHYLLGTVLLRTGRPIEAARQRNISLKIQDRRGAAYQKKLDSSVEIAH